MGLSVDGQRVILTDNSKQSKWRSLDQGDICQEKLSKSDNIFKKQKQRGLIIYILFEIVGYCSVPYYDAKDTT